MTAPAAFQATFSDFRIIKGRKVAQIILEVPIEGADSALDILGGVPRPDREAWVACARLMQQGENPREAEQTIPTNAQPASTAKPLPARAQTSSLYAMQAGRLCNDPKFRAFLRATWPADHVIDKDTATVWVREYCDVTTRANILPGTDAGTRWELLHSAYLAWNIAPACGVRA